MAWLKDVEEESVFLSVISIAEIRGGVERLLHGKRRETLSHWLETELPERFHGRILSVDSLVAHQWGIVTERARRSGHTLNTMDGFLAATALVYEMTLVTRNIRDFKIPGLSLLDPWNA